VITNSGLVQSAIDKWNLDYLKEHLNKSSYHVYRSQTNRFLYWDDKKCSDKTLANFKKPTELIEMNFNDFVDLIESSSESDEYK
jgi:hypothetical protein